MKKAYLIVLTALSIIILSWFLPWLYSLVFPASGNDPFVAYSPISNEFIVSQTGEEKGVRIFGVDSLGHATGKEYTKEDRDSLLPQIYFTQLLAHDKLPDSINGVEISMPIFKHSQWVFNSTPRDINKNLADVYLIMESMPERFELEDPKEVFRMNDKIEFIDIETNTVNQTPRRRSTDIFTDRGFKYPARSMSANITSRKAYDEGYLMVDTEGDIYHVKMQAGRPYMVKVRKPDSIKGAHVFIMENMDTRHLGLVTDENDNLYALEHEGYRLVKLPIGKFHPSTDRLTVVKNIFNWVVKVNDGKSSRWVAFDSDSYRPLGYYSITTTKSAVETTADYLFPFRLSFTDVSDCFARPRIEDISWHAIWIGIILALVTVIIGRRRKLSTKQITINGIVTVVFGIFAFIPVICIKN